MFTATATATAWKQTTTTSSSKTVITFKKRIIAPSVVVSSSSSSSKKTSTAIDKNIEAKEKKNKKKTRLSSSTTSLNNNKKTSSKNLDEQKLGEAVYLSKALVFVKDKDGKYTSCNKSLIERFGSFENTNEIIGKNDEEICKLLQSRASESDHFDIKHTYKGESISDLPSKWGANDALVREYCAVGEGKIFRERYASLNDGKFHEVLVYKTKISEAGAICAVCIPYMS
jgi:PAS domain-containing protein